MTKIKAMAIPHPSNFCGGNYKDWLEVNLTGKCNGGCKWCIERNGWHPEPVSFVKLANSIIKTGKQNILLLGGEPTLYPDYSALISRLAHKRLNAYLTTNGSTLNWDTKENLIGLKGLNISIHHYDNEKNKEITGVNISIALPRFIAWCNKYNIQVRFNCNLTKGYVDNHNEVYKYIEWAKAMGANSVRFAELVNADKDFVDATQIFLYHGLTSTPFTHGCNHQSTINGMDVRIKQACEFQTNHRRPLPENPEWKQNKVIMYGDGNLYDGWQKELQTTQEDNVSKTKEQLEKILDDVKTGKVSTYKAADLIDRLNRKVSDRTASHGGRDFRTNPLGELGRKSVHKKERQPINVKTGIKRKSLGTLLKEVDRYYGSSGGGCQRGGC